jgi:arginase
MNARDQSERPIAFVGAASSLGIRPYDGTREARHVDRTAGVLRDLGLLDRLAAVDLGDVMGSPYRDFLRPPGRVRNEHEVAQYSRLLADRVAAAVAGDRFAIVVGGDCSVVLGALLGVSRHANRIGLAYVDAHADFGTPEESRTGSAASMCLALAVGRGQSPLLSLAGSKPLVRPEDVVLIGRRDVGQTYYGHSALNTSGILDLPGAFVAEKRGAATAAAALERLGRSALDGFWIHVDADILDPSVMPAVDSPEPGGLSVGELAALVAPLAHHPRALGMEITIYDPALDPDRSCATRLVGLLERSLCHKVAQGGAT